MIRVVGEIKAGVKNAESPKYFRGVEKFNVVTFELCRGWQAVPMASRRALDSVPLALCLVMDHQGTLPHSLPLIKLILSTQ